MRYLASLVLLFLAACGSARSLDDPAGMDGPSKSRPDRFVITADELTSREAQDVYVVVQALRPTWLQRSGVNMPPRGTQRPPAPGTETIRDTESIAVYLDGVFLGGAESLRNINVSDIAEIRKIRAYQANRLFGPEHPNGAIVVKSRTE